MSSIPPLPNAERAVIDLRKLSNYCLDMTHPIGRHKAAVFRRALGFTASDTQTLADLILNAATTAPAVTGQKDEFGQRYSFDFAASNAVGSAVIRVAWIIRTGEDFPRLTSCYVIND